MRYLKKNEEYLGRMHIKIEPGIMSKLSRHIINADAEETGTESKDHEEKLNDMFEQIRDGSLNIDDAVKSILEDGEF